MLNWVEIALESSLEDRIQISLGEGLRNYVSLPNPIEFGIKTICWIRKINLGILAESTDVKYITEVSIGMRD